jgi:hypothetical protein
MRKSLKLRVCGNVHPVNFCCSRIDVILLFYSCNDHGKVRKYIWQIYVSASRQGFNRVALATICCASSVRLAARAAAVPPEDARNTAIVTMDTHLPLPAFTSLNARVDGGTQKRNGKPSAGTRAGAIAVRCLSDKHGQSAAKPAERAIR